MWVIREILPLLQDILLGSAKLQGPNKVKYFMPGRVDVGGEVTAENIIIATGSVPFVPPGKILSQSCSLCAIVLFPVLDHLD